MRRTTAAILFIACLGLLAAQWSGVHAHVDSAGFQGAVTGMHDHHHGSDDGDDDHEGDVDVRVMDYGLSTSKILVFLFAIGIPLFLLPPTRGAVLPHWTTPLPLRRRARWRPPLRGPPRSHVIA
jgi:hypothetical protein